MLKQVQHDEMRFHLTIRTILVICPTPSRDAGSGTGSLAATPRAGACQGDHLSGCGELPHVRQGMGATRPADASHRRARNQPSLSCQANHKRRPSRACVSFPGVSPHSPAGVKLCPFQILPHGGRGTAGAAGGGGVSPSDQTLTPLRHSLRECHLPFQGRIYWFLSHRGTVAKVAEN